jgi:peptidoglycan/LPS O-acetylase OafA/YrhL
MNKLTSERDNNFDLIRLFASLQVVVFHMLKQYKIQFDDNLVNIIILLLKQFPGVPIFFTISGFLVYQSFERNAEKPFDYFKNRFLRLYPGLWVMVIFMTFIILLEATISRHSISTNNILIWLFCQFSFFQFYTPEYLSFWGTGVPNSSLWTIVTEVQFYLVVPLLFYFARISKKFIIIICVCFIFIHQFILMADNHNSNIYHFISVSILNYLYYFLFGTIFYLYRFSLNKLWSGKCIVWFLCYISFNYFLASYVPTSTFKTIGSIMEHLLLSFTVLSFVYSNRHLSDRLLKGNDISYGIYIYHMIFVNIFVHNGFLHRTDILFFTILLSILIGFVSWRFIEKPALKYKNVFSSFNLNFKRS